MSAGEMVANDEAWTAMTVKPFANPLQRVSSRITQMLVSSPTASPSRQKTVITPHRPPIAMRRGPTRGYMRAAIWELVHTPMAPGNVVSPELSAEAPRASCRNSGMRNR